jgi:hypothetical protein
LLINFYIFIVKKLFIQPLLTRPKKAVRWTLALYRVAGVILVTPKTTFLNIFNEQPSLFENATTTSQKATLNAASPYLKRYVLTIKKGQTPFSSVRNYTQDFSDNQVP